MRDSLIADSVDIKFECSQCGQRIVVERSAAGQTADCPICLSPVTVPQDHPFKGARKDEPASGEAVAPIVAGSGQGVQSELEQAREEIARQHALFKKAVDECERLKANATHVQAEIKSFQSDRQQLKTEVALARQAAATADAHAVELAEALSGAQRDYAALRSQAEAEITPIHEQLSETATQLAAREKDLRESKAAQAKTLQSLTKAKAKFTKTNTEVVRLRGEVESLRQESLAITQGLSHAQEQLRDTQASLEAAAENHRQTCSERDEWRHRAEVLRQDLAAVDNGRILELRTAYEELQRKHDSLEITLAEKAAAAKKDDDVLRGIVARQNTALGVYHSEVRRMRRARFGLRLVYGIFALGMLALAFLALYICSEHHFFRVFGP